MAIVNLKWNCCNVTLVPYDETQKTNHVVYCDLTNSTEENILQYRVEYHNKTERYDQLSHADSNPNKFDATERYITGLGAIYDKIIPVYGDTNEYELNKSDIAAYLLYNKGDDMQITEENLNNLVISGKIGGIEIADIEGSETVIIPSKAADCSGQSYDITVTYTVDRTTYTTTMALNYSSLISDTVKYVTLRSDAEDTVTFGTDEKRAVTVYYVKNAHTGEITGPFNLNNTSYEESMNVTKGHSFSYWVYEQPDGSMLESLTDLTSLEHIKAFIFNESYTDSDENAFNENGDFEDNEPLTNFSFSAKSEVKLQPMAKLLTPKGGSNDWYGYNREANPYLKNRLSWLADSSVAADHTSMERIKSIQYVDKATGEAIIKQTASAGGYYRRACLSISYDKYCLTNDNTTTTDAAPNYLADTYGSEANIVRDNDYPAIVYAYSVKDNEGNVDIYFYVDDEEYNGNGMALLAGSALQLFQFGHGSTKSNLSDISGLARWDTSECTSMERMFQGAHYLSDLSPLNNWDTSKVTSMTSMFELNGNKSWYDAKLTDISCLNNWDVSSVTTMNSMFSGQKKLENISGMNGWNVSSVTNMSNMFTDSIITTISGMNNWIAGSGTPINNMFTSMSELTTVTPTGLNNWTVNGTNNNLSGLFKNRTLLTDINGMKNWNIPDVTTLSEMFNGYTSLRTIPALKTWTMPNVTSISSMFYNCDSLTNETLRNLDDWSIPNVNNMSSMFRYCDGLTDISGLNNWDISGNTSTLDMQYMFADCPALTTISGMNGWNISNATGLNTGNIFNTSNNLKTVSGMNNWNVSSLTGTNVRDLLTRFRPFTTISGLNNWDASSSTSLQEAFYNNSTALVTVSGMNNWDVNSVTSMYGVFRNCSALQNVSGLNNWTVDSVTDMTWFFGGCTALESISGMDNWTVNNRTVTTFNLNNMFNNASNLNSITGMNDWSTSLYVTNAESIFSNCSSFTADSFRTLFSKLTIHQNNLNNFFNNYPNRDNIGTDEILIDLEEKQYKRNGNALIYN